MNELVKAMGGKCQHHRVIYRIAEDEHGEEVSVGPLCDNCHELLSEEVMAKRASKLRDARQKEIRQVEEEIAYLGGFMNALIERIPKKDRNPSIIAAFRRTMIRLQSIRAELQKGMK